MAEPDSLEAACLVDEPSPGWSGHEARLLERFPVHGIRPIAMRPVGADGLASGPWVLADILDISLGGLGLLVSGSQPLDQGQHLQLDLRSHPDFGVLRLDVEVRWSISAESYSTFGIAFPAQLPAIPRLELERRGLRRDPNLNDWALEEA
ncbi:MAG: PilZ domain-containing protein [Vulcanococcus sp.]